MKKKLFVGLIALTALTVTSCTNDEVNEMIPQGKAIEFNSYLGRDAQARATELNATGLVNTGFGVYAYLHMGTASYTTANFMENIQVSGNNWGYGDAKYWPKETEAKINFLAYAPYDENASVTNGVLRYNIPTNVANQKDLVVAGAQLNQTSTSNLREQGTVDFTFYHMLSRLSFDITVTGAASATVTSASIKGDFVTSCTVDMKAVSPTTNIVEVTADNNDTNDITYSLSIYEEDKYMMIAPQTLSATVTIDYSVTYNGGATTTGTATGQLSEVTFAQGTAYKIKATVTGNQIKFNVVDVAGWGNETEVTIN